MARGRPVAGTKQHSRANAIRSAIAERREDLGVDVEQLARRSLLNRRTLDKYFEGDSPSPSFFLIAAVADALELSLDDLAALGRTGD